MDVDYKGMLCVWVHMLVYVFGQETESIVKRKRNTDKKKVKRPIRHRKPYSECSYKVGRM